MPPRVVDSLKVKKHVQDIFSAAILLATTRISRVPSGSYLLESLMIARGPSIFVKGFSSVPILGLWALFFVIVSNHCS